MCWLWNISKKKDHFGVGHQWVKIWRANEAIIPDFDQIEVGQTLVIPSQ